jgi:hypothetical protein
MVLFDFDGLDLSVLPFADAVRSAKGDHRDHQQVLDVAAVGDMGVLKVKAPAFQAAKQGL